MHDTGEVIEPGDIVGVVAGKISKNLNRAEHVQVVSGESGFAGNDPGINRREHYRTVAFLGQVPVKVIGKVDAGDYIVASGKNDGTGIAIAPEKMTPENYKLTAGRAWGSSVKEGLKKVNVVVGLTAKEVYSYIGKQDKRIEEQQREIATLRQEVQQYRHLAAEVAELKRQMIDSPRLLTSSRD